MLVTENATSPVIIAATTATKTRARQKNVNICYKLGAQVPARLVLYFLSWSGFLVSFMMRNDMNFALVAMTSNDSLVSGASVAAVPVFQFENSSAAEQIAVEAETMMKHNSNNSEFDWSPLITSVITSSFYWCYVVSQVVGGIATQRFGTKQVFGWSQFATALSSLCMPMAADAHYTLVIALRSIQGFASGLTWPAMYAIVAFWIPLSERSRFMSSFQGFSIGIGLTYPLCGYLIENFGWRYVFYTTGSLGMCWCLIWYLLAFNTPHEHPRITQRELHYIETNVCEEVKESQQMKVPWISIFKSLPVWAIAITTFGRIWIHYVFIVSGPSFMKNMLKFDYSTNGFLSGMPFICSYVSSVLFCYVADKLVLLHWLNLTNVRKIFTLLSQVVPGLLLIWIGYLDIEQHLVLLLTLWFAAVIFITASYAGAMANIVDISPNFAGPVLAFCQTIHMSASFMSPLVNGMLVVDVCSIVEWRMVFGLATIISISTYAAFQCFGTANIQSWNYAKQRHNAADGLCEQSQILKQHNEESIPIKQEL